MKKTPLKRYTSLQKSVVPLKRTRMKPMSKKRIKEIADEAANVASYRKLFPKCQLCRRKKATDIHEMFGEGRRHVARMHRSCILHLCRLCHDILQHRPKAMQLLLKMQTDPNGFDLAQYNALSPGTPITMKDIEEYRPAFS